MASQLIALNERVRRDRGKPHQSDPGDAKRRLKRIAPFSIASTAPVRAVAEAHQAPEQSRIPNPSIGIGANDDPDRMSIARIVVAIRLHSALYGMSLSSKRGGAPPSISALGFNMVMLK
jgi:hypothetical protein